MIRVRISVFMSLHFKCAFVLLRRQGQACRSRIQSFRPALLHRLCHNPDWMATIRVSDNETK